jgi:uncharacterized protein
MTFVSTAGQYEHRLRAIMLGWPERRDVIDAVAESGLPDCWLAAGFVRNTVWDCLHGHSELTPLNDVDVAYFEPSNIDRAIDAEVERSLRRSFPGLDFSVKNQARMHNKNGHQPYTSATDAISRWTETCTAVGVRRGEDGLDVCAPHGLADLFSLVVRPTSCEEEYVTLVLARVRDRGWLSRWPRLRVLITPDEVGS